jgi:hypothetical protein
LAGKAGFRQPTLVQKRYLDYLGIIPKVWTHPSMSVAAGIVASARHPLILLTSGALKELSDDDIRLLVERL